LGALKRTFGPKKSKVKKKDAHIDVEKPPSAVFFGDDGGAVYALDAQSGRLLWKTQADGHPLARIAGSPTLYRDRLYVPVASSEARAAESPQYACCTFRGSVVALDIGTGRTLWKTYMTGEEPKPYKLNAAGTFSCSSRREPRSQRRPRSTRRVRLCMWPRAGPTVMRRRRRPVRSLR
jgi:glucose dehydrogenase